jgi:hypothetical protein
MLSSSDEQHKNTLKTNTYGFSPVAGARDE